MFCGFGLGVECLAVGALRGLGMLYEHNGLTLGRKTMCQGNNRMDNVVVVLKVVLYKVLALWNLIP